MRISIRKIENNAVVGLWHQENCINVITFLNYLKNARHAYAFKAEKMLEHIVDFRVNNIFKSKDSVKYLEEVYDLIKIIIKNGDMFFIVSSSIDSSVPFLSPVPVPPLMFGLAGNCAKTWRDDNLPVPIYPVGYQRPYNSISGHKSVVCIPKDVTSFRCAAELGVVIGKDAASINPENAFSYIYGFTCVNDMISNHWKDFAQKKTTNEKPGFTELLATSYYGRGTDDFAPVGPWVVSKDEVVDPYNLLMYTRFNNVQRDRSYSNAMIVSIETTLAYLSSFMTLKAGSIIHMGTMGIDGVTIPEKMKISETDFVEIEIENLGKLRTYFKDMRCLNE